MEQTEKKSPSRVNFVLLGKTGSGKSAAGNTILGRKAFISKLNPASVSQDVQIEHGNVGEVPVTVYDTPGFFDTDLNDEQTTQKCQSVFNTCESNHCIFLLVIRAGRFTEEEKRTVEMVEKLLGQNRLEKTWILFTRGDELEDDNLTIEEFINDTPDLKKLVKKYQDRYHVFNNKKMKFFSQAKNLLMKIRNKMNPLSSHQKRKKPALDSPHIIKSGPSERRLVLMGKAGAGKSASGNTILGQKHFKSALGMKAVTGESEVKTAVIDGRTVSVVDTPGLCDTDMKPEELIIELVKSIYLSSPGAHAFLITLPLTNRFTTQEQEIIQQIKSIFGEEVTKYTIILFTHGDCLKSKQIEELIEENCALRELVEQCEDYHVFNNTKCSNREQVTELLKKIDTMVEKNRGTCYSNQMFEKAVIFRQEEEERMNREEEERLRKEEESARKEEEKRKQREEEQRQKEIERVKKETEERVRMEFIRELESREEEMRRRMEEYRKEMEIERKESEESVRMENKTEMGSNREEKENKKEQKPTGQTNPGYNRFLKWIMGLE